ncbi:ribose 5-phosphate isomerase B [Hydrogenoanaerobacterium sp.]|uniref:ribose 5-phosphate isomerase B n=1 Tax=Hydrogenoanaerobacterium sp. TaxID=2953763 RepID=UPI0028A009F7|nr:ribose 5-phosphate isomerase B [Hydrogenoanaerobacterium sp.]
MIAIGSDHGGFALKQEIIQWLTANGYEYKDFGTKNTDSCDYPDYALPVAHAVRSGECDKGILCCGTGIGISIAANKVHGIRAALCSDYFSAKYTRKHNDSNIICFGERTIGAGLACELVDVFLNTEFEGGRHALRVQKIMDIEKEDC